jgi:hypothetical protein
MRRRKLLAAAGTLLTALAITSVTACGTTATVTRTVHVTQTATAKPVPAVTKTVATAPAVAVSAPVYVPTPVYVPSPVYVPQPAYRQAPAYSGLSSCGNGLYVNSVTSCSFAENVESAWAASGAASYITAYSPVTGLDYTMYCTGASAITCTGGNNALVEF